MKNLLFWFSILFLACSCNNQKTVEKVSSSKEELRDYLTKKIGGLMIDGFCTMSNIQGNPPESVNALGMKDCLNPKALSDEMYYMEKHGHSPYRETVQNYIEEALNSWAISKEKIDSVIDTKK